MNNRYLLDKNAAKLSGVCAGLANMFGIDVTVVRVLTVLSLFILGPVTLLAYFIAALVAPRA